MANQHDCLQLRFPGSTEFRWSLMTSAGPEKFDITGPYACDDGEVLTDWALDGRGIVLKPVFEIAEHLASGALVPVCEAEPPADVVVACLFPHKRNQDPKSRLFMDFMDSRIKSELQRRADLFQLPR